MIIHWNMLPKKSGVSSHLEAVTTQPDQVLSNMI